jgi:hypothetical protein
VGLNIGGGAEYFLSWRDTLTGDITLHAVHGNATGYQARYWTITGGYKFCF